MEPKTFNRKWSRSSTDKSASSRNVSEEKKGFKSAKVNCQKQPRALYSPRLELEWYIFISKKGKLKKSTYLFIFKDIKIVQVKWKHQIDVTHVEQEIDYFFY